MSAANVRTLTVVGCGLMGGSFALALKAVNPALVVTGVGRTLDSLQAAQDLGVIDHASTDIATSVRNADVVVLGVPVGAMAATLQAMAGHLRPQALVMDVGSTKSDVVAIAEATLGEHVPYFVAAHPIAGKESSGVAHAQASLYEERRVILTPTAHTHPEALAQAKALWRSCGASVHSMSAQAHDQVFAAVSHLPHLLAFAYMNALSNEQALALAGPGFRDFTRIAASNPALWRDVFVANREALLGELAHFESALAQLKALVHDANATGLHDSISHASTRRAAWQLKATD
jgi:prephenate dehydrogenase